MPEKLLQFGTVNEVPIYVDVSFLGGPRVRVTIGGDDYVMTDIDTSSFAGRFPRRLYGMSEQPAFPITCTAGSTVELLGCEAAALIAAGVATAA